MISICRHTYWRLPGESAPVVDDQEQIRNAKRAVATKRARFRFSLSTRNRFRLLSTQDFLRNRSNRDKKHWREHQSEKSIARHAEKHSRADRLPTRGPGAGCEHERKYAEDECQRGHQDRPKSQLRGVDG